MGPTGKNSFSGRVIRENNCGARGRPGRRRSRPPAQNSLSNTSAPDVW